MVDTRPSANSATYRYAPVGDSAMPVGSEPTSTGSLTYGWSLRMPVIFTTVASARFATYAVSSSGSMTTELGSSPVLTVTVRTGEPPYPPVEKTETESSSGFTINTYWSSAVIATVPDFDGPGRIPVEL